MPSMTMVPELEAAPPRPSLLPAPIVPLLDLIQLSPVIVEPVAEPITEPVDDDLVDVEVQSPLAIIIWAAAVFLAGVVVVAMLLVLGPILGPVAVLATTVAIVRRYLQAGGPEPSP
jgi:hypothetical protein